jgi:hypothetical protein
MEVTTRDISGGMRPSEVAHAGGTYEVNQVGREGVMSSLRGLELVNEGG